MGFAELAPGNYAVQYDGAPCGLTEGPIRIRENSFVEEVRADEFGDTVIEGIGRGGSVNLLITFKEWKSPVKDKILYPRTAANAAGLHPIPGFLDTDFAKVLLLTAQTGSPAFDQGPRTITASLAILSPNQEIEWLMGNTQRDVPVLFQLYLFDVIGTKEFYQTTDPP